MALPACKRCGKRDPQRMHGLMSLWFGPLVEFEADLGYFYLCPACHDEFIVPELERIQNRILELHPAAQRHFHELEEAAEAAAREDETAGGPAAAKQAGQGSDEDAAGGARNDAGKGPAGAGAEAPEDPADSADGG